MFRGDWFRRKEAKSLSQRLWTFHCPLTCVLHTQQLGSAIKTLSDSSKRQFTIDRVFVVVSAYSFSWLLQCTEIWTLIKSIFYVLRHRHNRNYSGILSRSTTNNASNVNMQALTKQPQNRQFISRSNIYNLKFFLWHFFIPVGSFFFFPWTNNIRFFQSHDTIPDIFLL